MPGEAKNTTFAIGRREQKWHFRPAKQKKKIVSNKIRILLLLIFSINSLFDCARREMHDDLHNFHAYKKALPCTR